MHFFDAIDKVLIDEEGRTARVSRKPSVWPSEASAEKFDKTEAGIVGKCHRASIFRMIGEPITNQIDPQKALQFRTGRAIEEDLGYLSEKAGVFVASGVRFNVEDINLPLELDLVVLDPETGDPVLIECKTVSGYFGNKQVFEEGHAKEDNIMQETIYLNEFPDGKAIKAAIATCVERKRQILEQIWTLETDIGLATEQGNLEEVKNLQAKLRYANFENNRIRIKVNEENLAKMNDGPATGKLVYISRDQDGRREFNIGIWEDPIDGLHYPTLNGEPYREFCIESIYERFKKLQGYYEKMRDEAKTRLAEKGVKEPGDGASSKDVTAYWDQVGEEMRALPREFLPPAEYEWEYSDEKIQLLGEKKLIGATKYKAWVAAHGPKSKKQAERIGSWRCDFCDRKVKCIAMENPKYRHLLLDLMRGDPVQEPDAAA